jgi:hypothetical protein
VVDTQQHLLLTRVSHVEVLKTSAQCL